MRHFDGISLNRIDGLRARHDFTSLEDLNLELAVSHLRYGVRHEDRAAIDGIQIVRKARSQTPAQRRQFLRDCRSCDCGSARCGGSADCCTLRQKCTAAQILFHVSPPKIVLVLLGLLNARFPSLSRFLLLVLVLPEARLRRAE